ncbi:MAG: N-acetyltransferase family protein [Aeromicrobium sp.]
MSHDVALRPMTAADWPQVETIYAAGIAAGHATFEASVPTWTEFDTSRLDDHRLVAVQVSGTVLGWAACSPVSSRPVYAGVVEHSVYVADAARRQGVGSLLLGGLVTSTEGAGIWTVQSSIFPENTASLRLHASHGFRVVGTRERIARATVGPAAGAWRDTVVVERRSAVVGSG